MISVVGPGAVGGLLAALLQRAGIETTVVARDATARRIAAAGITVDSTQFGPFRVAVATATEVPAGNPVIVAVKAYGLAGVLPSLVTARPGEVLTLMNGFSHADLVHAALEPGGTLVACGSIQVESERLPDGTIAHKSPFTIVAAPEETSQWRVMRSLAAAGVRTRARGTESEVLWAKLRFLSPLALLTAATDLPLGEALRHEPALTQGLLGEVAALATAEGLPTSPEHVYDLLASFAPSMYSSLQLDVRRGGPNELDALGGQLIDLGVRQGIATPHLRRLVDIIGARVGA